MAEIVFDLRRAANTLPEDRTARLHGGELRWTPRATRMGIVSELLYSSHGLINQVVTNGDFLNQLIQVPLVEHWFLRSFGVQTTQITGAVTDIRASLYVWKAHSYFNDQLDYWKNPDKSASPPVPTNGIEPFVFNSRYWLQIASVKAVPVAAPIRFVQWQFGKELWQREVYPREILLVRVEIVAGGTGSEKLAAIPHFGAVRYPTRDRILERLVQEDGRARADKVFASMVEAAKDYVAEDD